MTEPVSFTCPVCGRVSHHPEDALHGYCGACHAWAEPYNPAYVHWFGEPWPRADWRAAVCEDDRYRIDVPVGSECCLCGEPVDVGDRGTRYSNGPFAHAECGLRSAVGNAAHLDGRCRHVGQCNEILAAQSYREQAVDVWRNWMAGRWST